MKKLKNYDQIITEDGSLTFYSKLYHEACHSTSGAIQETQLHYIDGCQIKESIKKYQPLNIFEVGFGVGVGFTETYKALKGKNFNFITTEIDDDLIRYTLENIDLIGRVQEYKKPCHYYKIQSSTFCLYILQGNARQTILSLKDIFTDKIHAIYQDAFSPKRNAILWTTEWFEYLKKISHKECILSTYSSSSSIRKSMIQAGWKVYKGEKFGPKRSSTRARLSGDTDQDILEHLQRSPAVTITDDNYESYTMGS